MAHDSSYVRLFSFSEVVRDLIAGFLDESLGQHLDLGSLSQEHPPTADSWDQRTNAVVWRGQRTGNRGGSVVFMFQFEAEDEWSVPVHVAAKAAHLYLLEGLDRQGARLPSILPYVLYNGGTRWTASKDIRDLIALGPYDTGSDQISVPYEVIEERFCPMLGNSSSNLAGMLFRAQRCRSVQSMLAAIEDAESSIRPNSELERAVVQWFKDVVLSARAPEFDFSQVTELGHLKETLSGHCLPTIEAGAAQRRDSGVRFAYAKGVRRIIARLARDRYGAKAEEALMNMISSIDSGETLCQIAKWLRRSKTAEELLEQVRKLWVPALDDDTLLGTGVQ